MGQIAVPAPVIDSTLDILPDKAKHGKDGGTSCQVMPSLMVTTLSRHSCDINRSDFLVTGTSRRPSAAGRDSCNTGCCVDMHKEYYLCYT